MLALAPRRFSLPTWFLVAISIGAFFWLKEVIFTAFLGVVFAVVLSFPVDLLSRWLPRGVAVLLTLALLVAGGSALAYAAAGSVAAQFDRLEEQWPAALRRGQTWIRERQRALAPEATNSPAPAAPKPDALLTGVTHGVGVALSALTSALSLAVLTLVLALFFVHEPGAYRKGLRRLVPGEEEDHFEELYERVARGLRHWVGGIAVSMALMGTFTAAALWLAGIENWALLGAFTFFGTFIPYAGAIASAVPGLVMALAQSNEKFLLACLVYLGVHFLEGYIAQPLVMKRAVTLQPAALLLWQLALASVGGALGVIVATPLFVVVKILVGYLYVERELGKRAEAA